MRDLHNHNRLARMQSSPVHKDDRVLSDLLPSRSTDASARLGFDYLHVRAGRHLLSKLGREPTILHTRRPSPYLNPLLRLLF